MILSPLSLAVNFVQHNTLLKLKSLCYIFIPVAFLPILAGRALIILIVAITAMFLNPNSEQNSLLSHYSTIIYSLCFLATALASGKILRDNSHRKSIFLSVYILVAGFTTHFYFSPWTPSKDFNTIPYMNKTRITKALKTLSLIPFSSSVTCRNNYAPHLLDKHTINIIGPNNSIIPTKTEYIFIDEYDRQSKELLKIFREKEYGVYHINSDFILLKKEHMIEKNADHFKDIWPIIEGESTQHYTGKNVYDIDALNTRARVGLHGTHNKGTLTYGPSKKYPVGPYIVSFRIKTSSNKTDTIIAILNVTTNMGGQILSSLELKGTDLTESNKYQNISLNFINTNASNKLEFRVYFVGRTSIWIDNIKINSPSLTLYNYEI